MRRLFRLALFLPLCLVSAVAFGAVEKWSPLGPPGENWGLQFHPSDPKILLLNSFRSTDLGRTWTGFENAEFIQGFSPANPGVLYALRAGSLFTSRDLGQTWNLLAHNPFPKESPHLYFHPTDPQILYASGGTGHIWKSTDGGKSWRKRSNGISGWDPLYEMILDPAKKNRIVMVRSWKGFYYSNDGGASFVFYPSKVLERFGAILADPTNADRLYAETGGTNVWSSTNGGRTWAATTCNCSARYISVSNDGTIVATETYYRIVKISHDHGKSWQPIQMPRPSSSDSRLSIVQPHPILRGVLFASFYRDLFVSRNEGATWQPLDVSSTGGHFRQAISQPSRPDRIFALGETLVRSTDGGKRWKTLHPPDLVPNDMAIHPSDPDMIVTGGYVLGISTDGGTTWAGAAGSTDREIIGVALDPLNKNTVYVDLPSDVDPNIDSALQKTTDQGKTWKYLPLDDGHSVATNPNSGFVFAGSHGKIQRSTDGGSTWQTATGCCVAGPRDFAFHPSNSSITYASEGAGVYKSTDGGISWVIKTGKIAASINSFRFVYVDPFHPDVVYAGDKGLYVSGDGGETWSLFGIKGLSVDAAFVDMLAPSSNQLIVSQESFLFSYSRVVSPGGPEIYQLSPQAATVGSTLTIVGKHFGVSQGASKVFIGSFDAGNASKWSDTRIEIVVPMDSRTAPLSLRVGGKKSNSPELIVLPALPRLFAPEDGPGSGQTRVAIPIAQDLSRSSPIILFGSTLARNISIQFTEDGKWVLTCTTPPGRGAVPVTFISWAQKTMLGQFRYR